jgi:hypothetical protein
MNTDFEGPALFSTGASGIAMIAAELSHLQRSYDALMESVYSALVSQPQLKPYLDAIEFTIDGTGLHFDRTALEALLEQKRIANDREALIDLAELNCFAMLLLDAVDFDGVRVLQRWVDAVRTELYYADTRR